MLDANEMLKSRGLYLGENNQDMSGIGKCQTLTNIGKQNNRPARNKMQQNNQCCFLRLRKVSTCLGKITYIDIRVLKPQCERYGPVLDVFIEIDIL